MADSNLNVRIGAKDQASLVLSGLMGKVKALAGAFLAFRGVKASLGFLEDSIKAGRKAAEQTAKLDAALRQVGTSYATNAAQIGALAAEQQKWTRYGGTATKDTLLKLLALTGDYSAAMAAVPAAQNLAEGATIDLGSAAQALGRAIAGNDMALGRLNPRLREGSDALAGNATAAERTAFWVGRIAVVYGDAARNIDPLTQATARLSNGWSGLKKAIGEALVPTDSAGGAFGGLGTVIEAMTLAVKDNKEAVQAWVKSGIGLALTACGLLVQGLGLVAGAFEATVRVVIRSKQEINDWSTFAKLMWLPFEQRKKFFDEYVGGKNISPGPAADIVKQWAEEEKLLTELTNESAANAAKVNVLQDSLLAALAAETAARKINLGLQRQGITLPETFITAQRPKPAKAVEPKAWEPKEFQPGRSLGVILDEARSQIEAVNSAVEEIQGSVMDLLPVVGTAGLRTELSALAESADQMRAAWADPETPARLEAIRDKISGISIETGKAVEQTWELDAASRTVQDVVIALASSFGQLFGALITGSENAAKAFAASMLAAIGQIAVALGTLLIGKAFETYPLINFGLMAIGAGLIAFGVSLGAIASSMGAQAKRGMGAGGYAGAAPSLNAANAASREPRQGQTIIMNINTGQGLDTKDSISRAVGEALVYGRRRGIMPAGAY